jgi:hypothetical protein
MALEYALDINAYTTKSIESILSKKLYMHKVPNVAINNSILNTHENLRGKITTNKIWWVNFIQKNIRRKKNE